MEHDGLTKLISEMLDNDKDNEIMLYLGILLPSELYEQLNRIDMNYYTDFIYNTINQICLINYCIEAPSSGNKENIVRCLWVDLILKRIQNIVLTLMAIPEVYVRNIMSDSSEGLMKYSTFLRSRLKIGKVFDGSANKVFCLHCKKEASCPNQLKKYKTNGFCNAISWPADNDFFWDEYYIESNAKGRTFKEIYDRIPENYGFDRIDDIMEFVLSNKGGLIRLE